MLILMTTLISFGSCGIFNDRRSKGYTGGFMMEPHFYGGREIHWFETFEEAMEVIEHLEVAGNDLKKTIISNYENDLVDAKYCFIVDTHGAEKKKRGQAWYDRKYSNVKISYYGFLEEVSIEKLEYSYIVSYESFELTTQTDAEIDLSGEVPVYLYYSFLDALYDNSCGISCGNDDNRIGTVHYNVISHLEDTSERYREEFPKSLVLIGE